ncbi:hypothetical protein ECE50_006110 [Chitinophaga sp. Mgbs1]|uniref:Uncharacterized protein n=1 Tax=Chitinophaga solisilvae TaxID=1233460 RepID=A0A433WHT7_9BACT|nr:hypothetical protein [Chitinophaga solisilvae]
MTVLPLLASAQQRRDEIPNQELAQSIAARKDNAAVKELVTHLTDKSKDIQHDCIKVLYETGELAPALLAPYLSDFIALLQSRDNRMQWGGMAAIRTITTEKSGEVYKALGKLAASADKGSVITKDNFIAILLKLYLLPAYAADVFTLLLEQLQASPANQLPMYAEQASAVIKPADAPQLLDTLRKRLPDIEKDSKKKRVEKVMKKLTGK